jgi:hypothetical protein
VFYSLLLDYGAKCNIQEGRCCISLQKKAFAIGESIDYSACVGFMLAMWKVRDNIKDEGNINKFVLNFCKKSESKAVRNIPDAVKSCERHFTKLNMLEEQKCNSADECAAIFSDMCAELCTQTPFSTDKDIKRIIYSIGKAVGKWVYIIDAIDDYQKDIKSKNFNPFYYEVKSGKICIKDIVDIAGCGLYKTLEDAYLGVNLLPQSSNKAILANIISYGMHNVTDEILREFNKKLEIGVF